MDFKKLLWDWIPNAEWDLIKWVLKNLGRAGLFIGLIELLRELRGGIIDWWFLGAVFVVSLSILYAVTDRPQPFHLWVELVPILCVVVVIGAAIWMKTASAAPREITKTAFPFLSSQDVEIREKIRVLFFSCGQPSYSDMQQLTNRLCRRFTNDPDRDLRDPLIATLAGNYAFAPCNYASGAMIHVLNSSDTLGVEMLRQRLSEFIKAYRLHVRWMHIIAPYAPLPPLNEDPGYDTWQEKHKLFRQELRRFAATDDFVQLQEEIEGGWQDTWGSDE